MSARRLLIFLVSLLITATPLFARPIPANAANCQFILGFLALQQLIPDQVGSCLSNVQFAANGDGLQRTSGQKAQGGLMVWRKSDNFTAFTDGFRTWINGPFGLQMRLNSQRFNWERNPEGLPIVPPPAPGERCHTAGLSLNLVGVDAGAGNFVGTFNFRNNLNVPCTLFGFVGAQLVDGHNNGLPTRVVPAGGSLAALPSPTLVTVPPGGLAVFMIHWEDVPVGKETTCPTSSELNVIPPDEFDSLNIAIKITACGGGTLDVGALAVSGDVSRNWSGYAASGGTFTSVTGTWQVAEPRFNGSPAISATWVGIGGAISRDLIQAGTEEVIHAPGQILHDAWIELLPAPAQVVPLDVAQGDSITVDITQQTAGIWLISITNNTSGQTFQTTVPYASTLSSAEWIQEAPSGRLGILPLDDFGTMEFSGGATIKNGNRLTIAEAGARPITMIDSNGNAIATPSGLAVDGAGFTVARIAP